MTKDKAKEIAAYTFVVLVLLIGLFIGALQVVAWWRVISQCPT